MNPSKSNWITKYFIETAAHINDPVDEEFLYGQIRSSGFIYGYTNNVPFQEVPKHKWDEKEKTKIVLLHSLFKTFVATTNSHDPDLFFKKVKAFYDVISSYNASSFFYYILPSAPPIKETLERIIEQRVQSSTNILEKSFSHNLTNALLFIDIVSFKRFLNKPEEVLSFFKHLEQTIINLVYLAYQTKAKRSKYEEMILQIFENSLRFSTKKNHIESLNEIAFDKFITYYGKNYILDITNMVLWRDGILDEKEHSFIFEVGNKLELTSPCVEKSIFAIQNFIAENKDEIPYFQFAHPVKKFYKHTSRSVLLLLDRNKKSLSKEVKNNKELFYLLAKATTKNLDHKEKKHIKKQLIELCKTIPALTVFILPGGSLLLPLLIKMIPQIIPATFNENLEE